MEWQDCIAHEHDQIPEWQIDDTKRQVVWGMVTRGGFLNFIVIHPHHCRPQCIHHTTRHTLLVSWSLLSLSFRPACHRRCCVCTLLYRYTGIHLNPDIFKHPGRSPALRSRGLVYLYVFSSACNRVDNVRYVERVESLVESSLVYSWNMYVYTHALCWLTAHACYVFLTRHAARVCCLPAPFFARTNHDDYACCTHFKYTTRRRRWRRWTQQKLQTTSSAISCSTCDGTQKKEAVKRAASFELR